LNSNTDLNAVDNSGIIVDNVNPGLSGFDHTISIAEVLNGVKCDSSAYINVLDANDKLIPLLTNSMDTSITEPFATKVYKGVFFEVLAEDGSKASYALIPSAGVSDSYVTSNEFTVNQQDKTIIGATNEYSVTTFLAYLYPSGNASMKLKRKNGFERVAGLLQFGDYLMVTSEDNTDSTRYDINIDGDSIRYISIKKSIFIMSSPLKTAKVGNIYSYSLKTLGSGMLSYESYPQADWLSLQNGVLSGMPESTDEGTVDLRITYASEEDTTIQEFTLTVIPDIPLAITSTPVEKAYLGETYNYTLTTTGTGTLSFDNEVLDAWIEWLTLEGNTLTGTPASEDVGSFEAHITFENELESTTQVFTITVAERIPLAITSTPEEHVKAGEKYSYAIVTEGDGTVLFESSPDTDWLMLENSILSGTPQNANAGAFEVIVRYANEVDTAKQAFTITVASIPLTISSIPGDSVKVGELYRYILETTGEGTLSFSSSPLANWLTFDGNLLSGTPESDDVGTINVSITFENEVEKITQQFTIVVSSPVSVIDAWADKVTVSPNPAFDYVLINNIPIGADIELISATGKVLDIYKFDKENLTIPVSHRVSGTYLIRLRTGINEKTVKLIIRK
jgi:hypothetical protein